MAQAKYKTIRQLEELVAHLAPQPDAPSTLRALPRSPDPAPLSPGRYRLQVTLGEDACNKLQQLKDLLAHQIPNGDPALIVERALDALLTQVHKRKTGMTERPRTPQVPAGTSSARPTTRRSRLKAAIRREVWPRDDGRCGFIGEDGHRCNETRGLEFAHVFPWAKGGADTVTNVGLRCITHNALEAERDYGTSFMARKRERKPLKVREPITRYVLRRAPSVHAHEAAVDVYEPTLARVRDLGLSHQPPGEPNCRAELDTLDSCAI